MRKALKTGDGADNPLKDRDNGRRPSAISRRGMEAIRLIEANRDLLLRYFALRGAKNSGVAYW